MGSESNSRPPIGSFAEAGNGDVFFARGDQNMLRWDGYQSDFGPCGVPAPTSAITMEEIEGRKIEDDSIDGPGDDIVSNMAGTYYAYLRFLDDRGNVSNLSPLGNRISLEGATSGVIHDVQIIVASELYPNRFYNPDGSKKVNEWRPDPGQHPDSQSGPAYQKSCVITSFNHGLMYDPWGYYPENKHRQGVFDETPQPEIVVEGGHLAPQNIATSYFGTGQYQVSNVPYYELKWGVRRLLGVDKHRFIVHFMRPPESPWRGNRLILYAPRYHGGSTWRGKGNIIKYTDVEVPTDSRVAKRQILRNKDGNVSTFYVDIEHTREEWEQHVREEKHGIEQTKYIEPWKYPQLPPFGTVYQSYKLDHELGEEVPLRTLDGTDLNISRHGQPPNFKKVIIPHYNRIFAAVNLDYRVGSAHVLAGSETVSGNSTAWTSAMVDRFFSVGVGDPGVSYLITEVDENAQELTLSEKYEGITSTNETYSISPDPSEKLSIHFSEALLPESWDRNKVVRLTDDPLAGEMRAMFALGPRLYVGFENRIFSVNYMTDPSRDGNVSFAAARGCANQRCIVLDGNQAFILDRRGVYTFDGQQATEISTPIQAIFAGEYDYQIDWSMSDHFHASHNGRTKTVRWFVSMGGFRYPRHSLVFNYKTNRWWVEEYAEPISCTAFGRVDSDNQTLWGGSSSRVFVSDAAASDGLPSHVPSSRNIVSSATPTILRDTTSILSTQFVGAPVHISEGKGEGQTRLIVGVGSGYIEVDRPFAIVPDSTSRYQVGGFRWKYSTPIMLLASPAGSKAFRSIETRFQPTDNSSTLVIKKFTDFSDDPDQMEYARSQEEGDGASTEVGSANTLLDTTDTRGAILQAFDGTETPRSKRGRSVRFAVEGVPNIEAHQIYSLLIEGVAGR